MSEDSGPMEVPGKPGSRKKKISEEVKKLSRSEKVRNYCIGLGALSALILGLVANFKGEPKADLATLQSDKTWKILRTQVNRQSEAINKLHLRMVAFQGTQEGFTAGKLQEKLEQLQRKHDQLLKAQPKKLVKQLQIQKKPTATAMKPAPKPKKECPPGWVKADGKCRKVSKAVAKRVSNDKQKMLEAKRKLEEERRRREELERKKRELQRKMTQQKQQEVPKLSPLPAKLDDA